MNEEVLDTDTEDERVDEMDELDLTDEVEVDLIEDVDVERTDTLDDVAGLEEELDELPPLAPHPSWMLLSCHVVVLEKVDHTNAVTAFVFAPVHADNGTVTVWEAPVNPVTVYQ